MSRSSSASWIAILVGGILGLSSVAANAIPTHQNVSRRASEDTGGEDPNDGSSYPSISADGRYVAFYSSASDLVAGDGNGFQDVFVRDLVAGTTVRASVDSGDGDPDSASGAPSISADARYVAFDSSASDLVPGDGNGSLDVFVRDLMAGATVRAAVDTEGGDPNGRSFDPSISADGRYVAFYSSASNLVDGDGTDFYDIFVRDLVAGTTVRASVDTGGGDPDGYSYYPSINSDGRYVAFWSYASDLVQGDGNGFSDIFVRDLVAGTTVRASVDTGGGDPDSDSYSPSISADGRYVAFESQAGDLVPSDGCCFYDIFVRDLVAGTTVRASVDSGGGDPFGNSFQPSISADGRYVSFYSYASDLVQGDGNGLPDIFVRDLVVGTTVRASVDTGDGDPNGISLYPSISADGRYVAFESSASDLIPRDGTNLFDDVFVRALGRRH
jgi:Tol biopolymer transport system component